MSQKDLTRWNRAGLAQFRYVDGNAVSHLERLRQNLAERFPTWEKANPEIPENEQAKDTLDRLEEQYLSERGDMLWEVTRSAARASHVLTEYLNAYANEGYLGTATQWENVRRMVDMLDYHPAPPASSITWLALLAKDGVQETVEAGIQSKYLPPAGGAPLMFETLNELKADANLNCLRLLQHQYNPQRLGGNRLDLVGEVANLKAGDPIVLEDVSDSLGAYADNNGALSAHLIQSVQFLKDDNDEVVSTRIKVSPPVPDEFYLGYTKVHVEPAEKLATKGPYTRGAEVGNTIHLMQEPDDVNPGDVMVVHDGGKPYFRYVRGVSENRVTFTHELGDLQLHSAYMSRPVAISVRKHKERVPIGNDGVQQVLLVAGDWSYLGGQFAADKRKYKQLKVLPVYQITAARYTPADGKFSEDDLQFPGYTALTLIWDAHNDHVGPFSSGDEPDLRFDNPQTLLVLPNATGTWPLEMFLQKSDEGRLTQPILTDASKKAGVGDLAVVTYGSQLAWGQLSHADTDQDDKTTYFSAKGGWQDRGGGPFYQKDTRVFAQFKTQARVQGWNQNPTPASGTGVSLEWFDSDTSYLDAGRKVLVQVDEQVICTEVLEVSFDLWGSHTVAQLVFADELPSGATHFNTYIYANVVQASHGEAKPEKVLGSGDASSRHQKFVLPVNDVAFVPDSLMPNGVKADVEVIVAGQRWQQVATLNDSAPADSHYIARITEDDQLQVSFGDGRNGRRLPTGSNNVRIRFRRGNGLAGNIPALALTKLAKPHRLLEGLYQPLEATGGNDKETTDAMRENAPASVLTLERAVSLKDFAQLARNHASVWLASAFEHSVSFGRQKAIEVVVVPAGGGSAEAIEETLTEFIQASTTPGISVSVTGFESVEVGIDIQLKVDSTQYVPEDIAAAVKQQVVAKLALSQRQLGDALYRGYLYELVEGIEGVQSSVCEITYARLVNGAADSQEPLQVSGPGGVTMVIKPYPRQVIHLNESFPDVVVNAEGVAP